MPPLLQLARYREIAAALGADPGAEIIAASAGLASAIAAEMLRRSGAGAISARIRTLDGFARQVVNDAGEYPRVPSDAERALAMRSAIAAIDDPMMRTRGIAAMLERTYRDVRDSGLMLDAVERNVRPLLMRAWRAYERLIAEAHAVDPSALLTRAAEIIRAGAPVAPQIVAGFYDMTGAQMRLISALSEAGKLNEVFVPATWRLTEILVGHGCAVPNSEVRDAAAVPCTASRFQDIDSELRAVCRSIRDLLDAGVPPQTIGITARVLDPDDIRILERVSSELGFTISESVDTPLPAHRLGRAIASLLRLRERDFPRAAVIDVLRDGYRPQRSARIDDIDVATRRARIAGGRAAALRNPSNDPCVDHYRAIVAELEALPASPAALMSAVLTRFRLTSDLDLAAAAAIDDILTLLERTKSWNTRVDTETAIELLEWHTLPRQPTTDNRQPCVWVGDVMTFRGRTFDHLFAIRMQESLFPQRRVDDPLLPDAVRRQVGVREIGDGRDEERLLFQLLFDGAVQSIHFSCAASDRFGKILRPSPLLKAFAVPWLDSAFQGGVEPPHSEGANLPRQLQRLSRAGTRSIFDGYLGDALRETIAEKLSAISPTKLEDFGECPQKFLLKHVFGVTDYDDPDRELQMHHREKGKLDHEILERFYRSIGEADLARAQSSLPQLDAALRERVDGIVDQMFAEDEMRLPPFSRLMREIEKKTTKRNLHAFLADDIEDLWNTDLRPRHFEYTFGHSRYRQAEHAEPYVVEAHGVPIRVEGSVDRIDVGAGVLRVVDYKSGKALRHANLAEKIDRGVRLQIALYAMAVAEFFGAPSVCGAIKPLIVRGTDPRKLSFMLEEKSSRLKETLDLFVRSMQRGAFPAFPNEDDDAKGFNSCKYCPVNHSCRTRHSPAEKRALEPLSDPRTLLESLP